MWSRMRATQCRVLMRRGRQGHECSSPAQTKCPQEPTARTTREGDSYRCHRPSQGVHRDVCPMPRRCAPRRLQQPGRGDASSDAHPNQARRPGDHRLERDRRECVRHEQAVAAHPRRLTRHRLSLTKSRRVLVSEKKKFIDQKANNEKYKFLTRPKNRTSRPKSRKKNIFS